jgi:UPF0042 nucleotide-binding protein
MATERRKRDLVLIGGVSGSGKNVALAALSDAGYFAVNNLPPPALAPTIETLALAGEMRVAVSLDARTGVACRHCAPTSTPRARPGGTSRSSISTPRPTRW